MQPCFPTRTYLPGDLIHREEPFVNVLPRSLKNDFCESCRCRPFNLRACKECLAVKYCGRACQKKDWTTHRLECKYMVNLKGDENTDFVHMLGRVVLKIKNKDWKNIKTSVLGTEVSFDDIDPNYKDMTENPLLNLLYKELMELTRNFIGKQNMPSNMDFLKITGKILHGTFLNEEKIKPGLCFFIGILMFDDKCIPNSSFIINNCTLKVWANRKIEKESEKISVSFRKPLNANPRVCKEVKNDSCKCCDCSLPYGDGVLSKILDQKKAYSVMVSTHKILKIGNVLQNFGMETDLKEVVDLLLDKHVGVLGRTNILHLKLLSFRCFEIGGHPIEVKGRFLELEAIMRSVFGEYDVGMLYIYRALTFINLQLGNIFESTLYASKAEKIVRIF